MEPVPPPAAIRRDRAGGFRASWSKTRARTRREKTLPVHPPLMGRVAHRRCPGWGDHADAVATAVIAGLDPAIHAEEGLAHTCARIAPVVAVWTTGSSPVVTEDEVGWLRPRFTLSPPPRRSDAGPRRERTLPYPLAVAAPLRGCAVAHRRRMITGDRTIWALERAKGFEPSTPTLARLG
jgi:hypothetical protein